MAKMSARLLVFLLSGAALILASSAFVIERSIDVPVAWNPVPWNVPPSLEVGQRGPLNNSKEEKIPSPRPDNILQILQMNNSRGPNLPGVKTDKESKIPDNATNVEGMKIRDENPSGLESIREDRVQARNFILLLVDDSPNEDSWKNLSLPVAGHLQTCQSGEQNSTRFPDKAEIFGAEKKECDCERILRSNIASLVSYARNDRQMTIGTVSATNFTVPSTLSYEKPMSKEFREPEQMETHKINNSRRSIDPTKSGHVSSFNVASNKDGGNFGDMWNIFELFARIKMGLFRAFLDSLTGARPGALQSNLTDLLGNTVRRLKSVRNENGYLFVAAVPGNELEPAVKLLRAESSVDTLLVVAGLCTVDGKSVPFFAEGPAAGTIQETSTIQDLPNAVKSMIARGCHGRIRRQDVAPFPAVHRTPRGPIARLDGEHQAARRR